MNVSPAQCATGAAVDVTELVESNLPLVGHLVREVLAKVPAHVSRDDLVSAGMMALVLSAQGYDPARGVPFARYASIRIRGALVDELRGMDWAARSVRSLARQADAVRSRLTPVLGRTPRAEELAAAMGVSVSELTALESDLARARTLSLHGFAPDTGPELVAEPSDGPEALLLLRERLGYLHDAIDQLPPRLRFVVLAYFFQQRPMAEIGAELGVTESRVSQLRAEALCLLRDGIDSQLEPTVTTESDRPGRPGRAAATRRAYINAVATSGTLTTRLAKTTARGDIQPQAADVPHSRTA